MPDTQVPTAHYVPGPDTDYGNMVEIAKDAARAREKALAIHHTLFGGNDESKSADIDVPTDNLRAILIFTRDQLIGLEQTLSVTLRELGGPWAHVGDTPPADTRR